MTHVIVLIGDLGGGKTTLGKVLGMVVKAQNPDLPVISNVEMGDGIQKVENVHKFIAAKLILKNKGYACIIDDEAAQSGLESRGSGSKRSAIESRVITHARKAHVDLILISQLKSMLDKRAQWVEDFSILCEAHFESGNLSATPDGFDYTVYDKYVEPINSFSIDVEDCKKYIWPGMDTDDIPSFEDFKAEQEAYWALTPADYGEVRMLVPER